MATCTVGVEPWAGVLPGLWSPKIAAKMIRQSGDLLRTFLAIICMAHEAALAGSSWTAMPSGCSRRLNPESVHLSLCLAKEQLDHGSVKGFPSYDEARQPAWSA